MTWDPLDLRLDWSVGLPSEPFARGYAPETSLSTRTTINLNLRVEGFCLPQVVPARSDPDSPDRPLRGVRASEGCRERSRSSGADRPGRPGGSRGRLADRA